MLTPPPSQTTEKNGIFWIIKKDFFSIPVSVRIISFSLFLFVFGWGLGADTFFSVYIKYIIDNVFRVSVIGAILALSKLFFTLPIGAIDDHSDMKSVILLSKLFYILDGFLYFAAGLRHAPRLLVIAVLINGFAAASLHTTYQTFVRKHSSKGNRCTIFGLYFSSFNLAFVLGALISSVLVKYVQLPYLFLFIILFSFLSLFSDNHLPDISQKKFHELFGKETFLHQFFREAFSITLIKNTLKHIRSYPPKLMGALRFEFFFNVLNYVGFLFIPIVAIANHLSLSQIAILFAVMKLPYIMNFLTSEFADRYDKKTIIVIIMIFLSFLYTLLGFNEGFRAIVTISFGIAVGLSIMRPILSGIISDHTRPQESGTITASGEFVGRIGDILGSLGFGVLSVMLGLHASFVIIGIVIFCVGAFQLMKILKKS